MKKKFLIVAGAASAAAAAYSHQADASTYTVKASDSLWGIATKFNTSVDELKKLNKLSSNLIFPNQTLKVSGSAVQQTAAKPVKQKTPPAQQAAGVHIVQQGESLSSIANKYGTSYTKVMELNGLDSYLIVPGQRLKVTGTPVEGLGSGAPAAPAPEATPEIAPVANPNGTKHTVQHGEYLSMIASKYNVSVADIKLWNGMTSNIIYSNQVLIVSATAASKPAERLEKEQVVAAPAQLKTTPGPVFNHQNLYDYGQCTWHVFNKRAAIGKGISTYWWHAFNWANGARKDGYTVDNRPEVGAIAQTTAGPYGHVAFVERVNPDGTVLVSETNYLTPAGVVGYRTLSQSQLSQYVFIH